MEEVATAAQVELFASSDDGIEQIGATMITSAAETERFVRAISAEESALPAARAASGQVAPLAHLIWSHFGGDSGGW